MPLFTMHDTSPLHIIYLDLIVCLSVVSVTGYPDGCRLSVWWNCCTQWYNKKDTLYINGCYTHLTSMEPCIINIFLSMTNKMQHYTVFFITVNALHVSGGFSAHHEELKNCTHSIWYMSSFLVATASGSSKQAWHIPDDVCAVLSSWWWAEKPPETCRALTAIKNIV